MPRSEPSPDQAVIPDAEWRKLQAELRRFAPEIRRNLNDRLRVVSRKVARDAQRRAPVRSGALRKGITATVTRDRVAIISKAPHARISEFGGRHPLFGNRRYWYPHKARPHMRPAMEAAAPDVEKAASEAVTEAARAAGWR